MRGLSLLLLLSGTALMAQNNMSLMSEISTLRNGLVGAWRFEESTGTRYASVGTNSFTANNAPTNAVGRFGNAIKTTAASSQYLSVPDSPILRIGTTSMTFSVWVNLTTLPAGGAFFSVFSKYNSGATEREYTLLVNGTLTNFAWAVRDGANANTLTIVATNQVVQAGVWYNVICEYDSVGNQITIEVNTATNMGTVFNLAIVGGGKTFTGPLWVGGRNSDGLYLNGLVDELYVWKRLLTASEKYSLTFGWYPRFGSPYPNRAWTRLASFPGAPVEQHAFEECGGLLYVVAGTTLAGTTFYNTNSVFAYDPVANSWAQKADYPVKVQSLGLRTVNGKLYGISGYDLSNKLTNTYEFDPALNSWTSKTGIPIAIEDFATCVVSNKIWTVGGLIGPGASHTFNNLVQVFDPSLNSWAITNTVMPNPRALGDFGCSDGTNLWCVSGTSDMSVYPGLLASTRVDYFSPASNSWTQVASLPVAACYKDVEWVNGKIYSLSGATAYSEGYTPLMQVYTVASNSWTLLPPCPLTGTGSAMCKLGNKIYIVGGENGGRLLTDLWVYDPSLDTSQ